MYKRFQYFTKNGIKWSEWFKVSVNAPKTKWQVKGKLLNEYKQTLD